MTFSADALTGTADVIGTELIDGEIRVQIGDASRSLGYAAGLPMYGPDGFIGRPNQPDENGDSCQVKYIWDGDQKTVVGTRDNRYADKVGQLEPGDRAIVTDGEARILIKREDDAVFIIAKSQSTGKTMSFELNSTAGVVQIFNGNCWQKMTGDTISWGAGDGTNASTMILSAAGLQINGANFMCCTAGGHLGLFVPPAANFPGAPPQAPAQSILFGPTVGSGAASGKWTVAP